MQVNVTRKSQVTDRSMSLGGQKDAKNGHIRDVCTNACQSYDQFTEKGTQEQPCLLLYALITAQRQSTNVYTIRIFSPHERVNMHLCTYNIRSKQRITNPLKVLYALADTHIQTYVVVTQKNSPNKTVRLSM